MELRKLFLLAISFVIVGCAPGGGGGGASGSSGSSASTGGGSGSNLAGNSGSGSAALLASLSSTGTTGGSQNSPSNVGIKNFEEINNTMGQLTGIAGDAATMSYYKSIQSQLPGSNDIGSFSLINQMSITSLAAQYCSSLVTNGGYSAQRTSVFGSFASKISSSLTSAFPNAASETALANTILMSFWGANYATAFPNGPEAVADLTALIASLVQAGGISTANVTIAACTAALSTTQTNSL